MTMRLQHILLSLLAMLAVIPANAGTISRTDPVITVAVPNITRPFGVEPTDLPSGQTIHASSTDYLLGGSLNELSRYGINKYFYGLWEK